MPNSIQTLLAAAAETLKSTSDTALLDAEVLLCFCLRTDRAYLRTWPERQVNQEQCKQYHELIAQRREGMPIAYLTGAREFWSRNFKVTSKVLIPRPETELLIELALSFFDSNTPCKIIDLGAGSGIIAITLAAERTLANVLAVDIDPEVLVLAEQNARHHRTNNVHFIASNWFEAVRERDFDLVISNPPYIGYDDPHLRKGDVRFEPEMALVSPENGLKDIRQIAAQSRNHLKIGGYLLIEHGYDQKENVQAIFSSLNYCNIQTHCDLSSQPRVTSGTWNPL